MANLRSDLTLNEIFVTEKKKNSRDYLEGMTDYWIGKLVINKEHIPLCRKYYSGVRDTAEYEYLNDNYGIGNAIDIQFTPIIKPRIDALVGLFLSESFSYRVSVTDDITIDLEEEEKKEYILNDIEKELKKFAKETEEYYTKNGVQGKGDKAPPLLNFAEKKGAQLAKALEEDFISIYAEAAQHLILYFEQSNDLDFRRKTAELLYDLLITGEMFWRIYTEREGDDPILDVVKPENIFFNKNKSDLYLDTADAVVHREYMTRHQVIQKYGHLMTEDEFKKISGRWGGYGNNRNMYDPELLHELSQDNADEFSNYRQFTGDPLDVIEVFHAEWLASNRYDKSPSQDYNPVENKKELKSQGWIESRYEMTRILGNIYVGGGKSKNVVRKQGNPYKANLSYDGISYNLRQGAPYSMVYSLKDVQDMYDITQFHRNNLIANSGVAGTRVNVAGIPKILGGKFMDRLMKWTALRKQGYELVDPTEEGAQLFNHYGEFQGGIDGNAMNGINAILQTFEHQVVLTTGVTDQMLGQIEQREAVENVKAGIRQVSLITLNLFDLLDGGRRRMLTKLIDQAKTSYKKGKKGTYRVGSKSIAFNIDKNNFSYTDYNIQVTNSSKDYIKIQKLGGAVNELIGANIIKPEVAIDLILTNTVFEAKKIIAQGFVGDEQKDQQMQQMQQQLQDYEKQIKDAGEKLSKASQDSDKYSAQQVELEKQKFEFDKEMKRKELELSEKKLNTEKVFKDSEAKARREIVQLEREQLHMSTDANKREINNSKF
ncbi:MAG: hypothetical protein KAH32_04645 [Chlamydiia bacterium]|nr:hypothetical protein [Chlamydiia bacterium]